MRSYRIISELSSKLKKVYKVESENFVYILKEYASAEDAEKEMQIAKRVALTGYAPKVIKKIWCYMNILRAKTFLTYSDGQQ